MKILEENNVGIEEACGGIVCLVRFTVCSILADPLIR